MKTKVIQITDRKKVQNGDSVILRRVYSSYDTVVTVEGKARGNVPQEVYVQVDEDVSWPLAVRDVYDRDDVLIARQEFLFATRTVETPPLPTNLGTIAWIEAFSVELRTLSRYPADDSTRWHGVNGFIDTSTITSWQPLTPETLSKPDPDAWIEV